MRVLLFAFLFSISIHLSAQNKDVQNDRYLDSIVVSNFLKMDNNTFLVSLHKDTLQHITINSMDKERIELELQRVFAKTNCESCELKEIVKPKDAVAYFLETMKKGDVFLFTKSDDGTEVRLYREAFSK